MAGPQYRSVNKKKIMPVKITCVASTDCKDIAMLRRFISEHGKICTRHVTRLSVQNQRKIALAIRNTREVALLPYALTAR